MRKLWAFALLFVAWSGPVRHALAWGHDGHQLVGSIADALLEGTQAGTQVQAILGYKLRTAAKWPDCVKSIAGPGDNFKFPGVPTNECANFSEPSEVRRMESFVRRNWSNCKPEGGEPCHNSYHYANVAIQRGAYSMSFGGANDHDIVHAINGAILVLQGKPAPLPFSIRDKKETLFLLAHFVGDLHQLLHIGSIYLTEGGDLMDPDVPPGQDRKKIIRNNFNKGGNDLTIGNDNLHSRWDDTPNSWGDSAWPAMIARAKAVPKSIGQIQVWPALWASEGIRSRTAGFRRIEVRPKEVRRLGIHDRRQPVSVEHDRAKGAADHQSRGQARRSPAGDLGRLDCGSDARRMLARALGASGGGR